MLPGRTIFCPNCSELFDIRSSRLRLRDLPHLLIGKRPLRCMSCHERFYASFTTPRAKEVPAAMNKVTPG